MATMPSRASSRKSSAHPPSVRIPLEFWSKPEGSFGAVVVTPSLRPSKARLLGSMDDVWRTIRRTGGIAIMAWLVTPHPNNPTPSVSWLADDWKAARSMLAGQTNGRRA